MYGYFKCNELKRHIAVCPQCDNVCTVAQCQCEACVMICDPMPANEALCSKINFELSISDRKLCFNPIVLNIFNRFVYKSITLSAHILVIYFQSDQTLWD